MLKLVKGLRALHRYSVTVKFLLLTYTEIVSYIIYIYIIREYFCTHRSRIFNCNTVTQCCLFLNKPFP